MASPRIAAGKVDPEQVRQRSEVARKMTERLTSEEGRALYARQACTIEHQFGDDKHNKGLPGSLGADNPHVRLSGRCTSSPKTCRRCQAVHHRAADRSQQR